MKKLSKRVNFLLLALIIAGFTTGCVNMHPTNIKSENPEIVFGTIPKNFDWKMVKELTCTIKVNSISGISDNMIRVIRIFNSSQLDEGALIVGGAAKPNLPYIVKITLPTAIQKIYVQEILPDGTTNLQFVVVTGYSLDINFVSSTSAGATIMPNASVITANVPIVDNDGDGVSSSLDVDDNDSSVAFASYFPSASTWGTYIFEDLWPVKGDYDVNDMVLGFKVTFFTNSSNLVTKLNLDYNMKAAGCSYNLATAFQLDNVQASNVTYITGQDLVGTYPFAVGANGTENGIMLAVTPLFNNQHDIVSFSGYLNTESGSNVPTPDKLISMRFTTPVLQANVTMSSFNMFIVANEREREIHLPTFKGTTKFNASLANGYHLNPDDLFKNSDGMMWGLMIPEPFEYPSEKNLITQAYIHFSEWATSGGTNHQDWYKPLSGNTNDEYIYSLFDEGSIGDVDGNIYHSVTIGTQTWMVENLKTTKYRNGNLIGTTNPASLDISAESAPKYQWAYAGNESNVATYGRLYTGYAINDNRAICPTGWHVPSDAEWSTLSTYLGGESVAGGKLKEAGTTIWTNPNYGASNSSGFSALPGGVRRNNGDFDSINGYGGWWSSSEAEADYVRGMWYDSQIISRDTAAYKKFGLSVRCIKGEPVYIPTLTTTEISGITAYAAISGGTILNEGSSDVTSRGICWGIYANPTIISNSKTIDGAGDGNFTSNIYSGLMPGTTYYVRAYATSNVGTAYGNSISFSTANTPIIFNSNLSYGVVKDVENNEYKTIVIGTQTWMAENLKTTRYNNGDLIGTTIPPTLTLQFQGINKFQWAYNGIESNVDYYGRLYTWHSVTDTRNICPTGWHVPSDIEWTTIVNYLGGSMLAVNQLKEVGEMHWHYSNIGNNSSGFTALPGGNRGNPAYFAGINHSGAFWSCTQSDADYAWNRGITTPSESVLRHITNKSDGLSVRCLKDTH